MLRFRVISGILLGGGFLLSIMFLPPLAIWGVALLTSTLGLREFYAMMDHARIPVFRYYGLLCGAVLISTTFLTVGPNANIAGARDWDHLVILGCVMLILVRQFPQKNNEQPLATLGCTLLGVWYVPYLFNYFTRLALSFDGDLYGRSLGPTGMALVTYAIVVIKCTDIGAYAVGRCMGRHKFFPRLSPKKTWEGFVGGLALATGVSVGFHYYGGGYLGAIPFPMLHAVTLGIFLAVVSVVGDLFESLLKRASGIKDSSALVPGMGGLLDVLDSLLFGGPAMYAYTRVFLT